MIDRVEHCRQKANECERLAATTSDPNKRRASYVDMAKRGREMADHTERWAAWSPTCANRNRRTSLIHAPPVTLGHASV